MHFPPGISQPCLIHNHNNNDSGSGNKLVVMKGSGCWVCVIPEVADMMFKGVVEQLLTPDRDGIVKLDSLSGRISTRFLTFNDPGNSYVLVNFQNVTKLLSFSEYFPIFRKYPLKYAYLSESRKTNPNNMFQEIFKMKTPFLQMDSLFALNNKRIVGAMDLSSVYVERLEILMIRTKKIYIPECIKERFEKKYIKQMYGAENNGQVQLRPVVMFVVKK